MGAGIACAICEMYRVENLGGADVCLGERCRCALCVELLMLMVVGERLYWRQIE